MKKVEVLGLVGIIVIAGFLLFPPALNVSAAPPEPYELYGVAYQESGEVLPNGTPIRSFVDGVDYSNKTSVFSRPGRNDGLFDIDTFGNWMTNSTSSETPWIKEGAEEYDPIMYTWGDMSNNTQLNASQPWLTGIVFKEMHEWHTGLPPQYGDLNASPASLQPPLLKIQTIVTNSSVAPNNDYVWLCNPTPNPVEASQFHVRKDIPGSMWGPVVSIPPGTIAPYSNHLVDLGSKDYFVETGDNVRLVWLNNPSNPDAPFAGLNLTVDRVEFNATVNGTLYWEPGNTIQKDEQAPPAYGFQINRSASCGDMNSESQDFFINLEPGFGNNPPLAPWPLTLGGLSSNSNDSRMFHFRELSGFLIEWTHNDSDGDPQTSAEARVLTQLSPFPIVLWSRVVSGPVNQTTFSGLLQKCTDYWLQARTKDWGPVYGPYATLKFHTNCPPQNVSNLAPPDLARLFPSSSQLVWWSFGNDSDPGDTLNYSWQVSINATFSVIVSSGLTTNNYSTPFVTLWNECYYWHVNATDGWEWTAFTPTWKFCTGEPKAPTVNLTNPVGGEYWRGGSIQILTWTASDDTTPANLLVFYLNYTSSAGSGPIAGPILGLYALAWTLPMIDAADVSVNITAIDIEKMKGWDESGPFTIDSTRPSVSAYLPTGWNLLLNVEVKVTFSEPVNNMSIRMKESFGLQDAGTKKWINTGWIRLPSFDWPQEIRFIPSLPLNMCTAYTAFVNGTFFDRALWPLLNPTAWTFHTICPPTVSIISIVDGKVWSGGSNHIVTWVMSDEIDTRLWVWANYSKNGGADGYPYSILSDYQLTGTISYTWAVPRIDTTAARIRITVMDSSGLTAAVTSGNFTIDSTPPSILSSVPSNNSKGVKINTPIQVVFSESVVRASAEQAFAISPNPGDIIFNWQTVSGKDMLIVTHKQFEKQMDYTVTFDFRLKDKSDPGNSPWSTLILEFSTKPPPDVRPPVAKAVGKNQVQVGEPVTFDGRGSTGNITKYVWTITNNQGRIIEVLVGSMVVYTFTEHGRYRVTLRVIDESTGAYGEDKLEINVTSNDNAWLLLLLISALLASAMIGGTEVGRVTVLTMFAAPAYRRKQKGKEDAETRGMVKGYILVHPGDTYTDIKRNLELGSGSLTYHLSELEKDNVIKSRVQGTRKKYYPAVMTVPSEDGGELHDIERMMLNIVDKNPGMTVKIIGERLGVSSQLALYHLRRLSQRDMISLERSAFRLKAYPISKKNA